MKVVVTKGIEGTQLGEWKHSATYPRDDAYTHYLENTDEAEHRVPETVMEKIMNHPDMLRLKRAIHGHDDQVRAAKQMLLYDITNGQPAKKAQEKHTNSLNELNEGYIKNAVVVQRLKRNLIAEYLKTAPHNGYKARMRNSLPFYYPSMLFDGNDNGQNRYDTLEAIMNGGEIKNTYRLHEEQGFDPIETDRMFNENRWHDLSNESPTEYRPKYAYLDRVPYERDGMYSNSHNFQGALNYAGRHELILSPHDILKSSTISAGDTCYDPYIPHPVFDPNPTSGIFPRPDLEDGNYPRIASSRDLVHELQIHGQVQYPEHISGIVFRGRVPNRTLTDKIESHGIKWALNPHDPVDPNHEIFPVHNLLPLLLKYAPDADPKHLKEYQDYESRSQDISDSSPTHFKYHDAHYGHAIDHISRDTNEQRRNRLRYTFNEGMPQSLVGEQAYQEMKAHGFPSLLGRRVQGT